MTKNKIILTGFKPFFGNPSPTEHIVCYFKSCITIPNVEIVGLVLPNSYFAFEILSQVMDKEKPDAIISIGFYPKAKKIKIETRFRNLMNGKYPDAVGYHPTEIKISEKESAKEFLAPETNNLFMANELSLEKIPVELSDNAGTFTSNALGYLTTQKILNNHLPISNMFIHIPWTDNYKDQIKNPSEFFLKKDEIHKAIKLIIKNIC